MEQSLDPIPLERNEVEAYVDQTAAGCFFLDGYRQLYGLTLALIWWSIGMVDELHRATTVF